MQYTDGRQRLPALTGLRGLPTLRAHVFIRHIGEVFRGGSGASCARRTGVRGHGISAGCAQSPAIDGVLVLQNGNVLAGAVRRYGDDYQVDSPDATMRVPAAQVEMFAATLEEAYEARRAGATRLRPMRTWSWPTGACG